MIGFDETFPIIGGEILLFRVQLIGRAEKAVEVSPSQGHGNLSQEQCSPVKVDDIPLHSVGFPPHDDILQVQIWMVNTFAVQTSKAGRYCAKNFFSFCLTDETVSDGCP